ncbi:hypothetical protein [Burkholderia ubonensis]|uniref:hypothetical protein n=1 Tax=Burkholderia ubonensis TaxID=101571 RepID=UPI001178A51F|nr:hypothetical protein [Burkholderia ubonensis]
MDGTIGAAQFPCRCVTGFDSSCVEARRLLQEKRTRPGRRYACDSGRNVWRAIVADVVMFVVATCAGCLKRRTGRKRARPR